MGQKKRKGKKKLQSAEGEQVFDDLLDILHQEESYEKLIEGERDSKHN